MQRETAVKWYVILGLVLWAFGEAGTQNFELGSFPFSLAVLVRTVGLAVFLAVVVAGVWQSVRRD